MKKLVVTCLGIVLSVVTASPKCWAEDVFFTGAFSDSWHDEDNWSDGNEPSDGPDDYFVQDELTATYSTGTSEVRKLVVSDTSPGTFLMTGGDLSITGGSDSFQIGRGCCDGDGLVDLSGTAILRTVSNSGVGERDKGVLHIGPDASVISPDAYWRIGNFGPTIDNGLEGEGLLDVEGTFNSRSLFIGVQDGTGVVQVRGTGSVTLTPFADGNPPADINMNFHHDPDLHPNQSGTIHMIGSTASMSARTLQSQHDEDSPIKNLLWFTADEGGVSPITLAEEVNIDNNKLKVDLNGFFVENLGTMLLIDAAPGEVTGTFAELEITGGNPLHYDVVYDQGAGDILLRNLCPDCVFDPDFDDLAVVEAEIAAGNATPADGLVFLTESIGTVLGDTDLDRDFDPDDLITVFAIGEYDDGIAGNSTYVEGDWNFDADFDPDDLIEGFAAGHYDAGGPSPVPEPGSLLLAAIAVLTLLGGAGRPRRGSARLGALNR